MTLHCEHCQSPFEASNSRAKFCSKRCKTAAYRHRLRIANSPPPTALGSPFCSRTFDACQAALLAAGRVDSYLGAAALALAEQVDRSGLPTAGYAALVKELRATMTAALQDTHRAPDQLDELRARRDSKRTTSSHRKERS